MINNIPKKIALLFIVVTMVCVSFLSSNLNVLAEEQNIITISSYGDTTFMIDKNGSLWAWGANSVGQIGDGTTLEKTDPVKIMDNVLFVSSNHNTVIAIKTDGSLWIWGKSPLGQMGNDTTGNRHSPVKIMEEVKYASIQPTVFGSIVSAIKKDGSLWRWGENYNWRIGDGTKEDKSTPVKIMDNVLSTSDSWVSSMALKSDGSLWSWGNNYVGSVGDGTKENRFMPIKIMDDVLSISESGGNFSMAAIKKDGSLWMWGANAAGQADDGTAENRLSPVKVIDNTEVVIVGSMVTAAIKTDGSLWAWGQIKNTEIFISSGNDSSEGTFNQDIVNWTIPTKITDNIKSIQWVGSIPTKESSTNKWSSIYASIGFIKNDNSLWIFDGFTMEIMPVLDSVTIANRDSYTVHAVKTDGTIWKSNSLYANNTPTFTQLTNIPKNDEIAIPDVLTLSATPINVGVKLWWNPMPDTMGYRIYRSETKGEEGISITDFYITSDEFIDVNVFPNKTYYYTIRQVLAEAKPFDGVKEQLGSSSPQIQVTTASTIVGGGAESGKNKQFILMTINEPYMIVNGNRQEIDPGRGTVPLIINARTMIPIRSVVESMGGTVGWKESNGEITLNYNGKTVTMWLNSNQINVNGTTSQIDVSPQSINDRTVVPIRFAAENLDCAVDWLNSTNQIVIVF